MGSSDDSFLQMSSKLDKYVSCVNFYSNDKNCNDESGRSEERKNENIDNKKSVVDDSVKSCSIKFSLDSVKEPTREKDEKNNQEPRTMNKSLLSSECGLNSKQEKPFVSNLSRIMGAYNNSFERLIGLNLFNPAMTVESLRMKLEGRKLVAFDNLKNYCEHGNLNEDWVVVGAVCSQTNSTAKTGSKFSVWTLSDLKVGLNLASLFLFGESHNRLWKNGVGTVVGILNPSVMESKNDKVNVAFSVNNADRVMVLGQSKDLGFCTAKTSKGGICNSVINKHRSEYCLFHFKKNNNSKSYSQSGGRQSLQNKILGKSEVFYAGQSFAATKPTTQKKNVKTERFNEKDKNTLKKLFKNANIDFESSPQPTTSQKLDIELSRYKKIKDAELLNRLSSPKNSTIKQTGNNILTSNVNNSKLDSSNQIESKTFSRESLFSFFDKKLTDKTPKSMKKGELSSSDNGKILIDLSMGSQSSKKLQTKEVYSSVTPKDKKGDKKFQKGKGTLKKLFSNLHCESPAQTSSSVEMKCNRFQKINYAQHHNTSDSGVLTTKSNGTKENDKTGKVGDFSRESLNSLFEDNPTDNTPNFKAKGGLLSNLSNSKIIIDLPANSVKRNGALAKLKALNYVNKHGPFKKRDLSKNWGQNPAKRQKVISELKEPSIQDVEGKAIHSEEDPSRNKSDSDEQSIMSARFVELMNRTSKHKDLLDKADEKFMEEYFSKMCKKEDMEVVMLNTFKVPCKAIRCIKCRYTWFSPSDLCKSENHPIVTINATKRFFSCEDCRNRTVCLTILPLTGCKKCGSTNWKRAPILNLNKTVANLNDLCIRGGEQKFINSVESNTSLNLLVPD